MTFGTPCIFYPVTKHPVKEKFRLIKKIETHHLFIHFIEAIILTSGTNVGAARYVAEAMHQSKIATRESLKQCADVVTVGITSWNTLQGEQRSVLEKALGEKVRKG